MQKLKYLRPETLRQAIEYAAEYGERLMPYAGGTDIMVQLREHSSKVRQAEYMMDLQMIREFRGISNEGDHIRIGSMETHAAVASNELVKQFIPILGKASSVVGSPQIRNRGTIGGNIINASPAADTLSVLTAYEAVAEIVSSKGERSVPITSLYNEKGGTALAKDELLSGFRITKFPGYSQAYTKLGRRKALAISRLNVSVLMKAENDIITDIRIAPGCVFRTPRRVLSAEQMIVGNPLPIITGLREEVPGLFRQAAAETAEEMNRISGVRWSTAYKQPALIAVVEETLMKACIGCQIGR